MKIIILTDVYLPFAGGGQFWVWEIAKKLVIKYHSRVEIVTRKLIVEGKVISENESFYDGDLKITRLGFAASWNNIFSRIFFMLKAILYLLKADFDLIDAQAFVSGIPGKIVSIIRKKPVIFTVHGTNLETGRAGLLEKIILTKIKYHKEISVASSFLRFKNVNKNVIVIHPGVDLEFFKPNPNCQKKNRIIFIGRLVKEKGIDNLMYCLDRLSRENVKWVIIGEGEGKKHLNEFVEKNTINNVEFLGVLHKKQILQELQKSDIFFLPSHFEGFPLSLLEAKACGLSLIASDIGDIKDIIRNNVNGFLVKHNNPGEFFKALQKIVNNDDLKKNFYENNVNEIKNCSWDKTAEKIYKVYIENI